MTFLIRDATCEIIDFFVIHDTAPFGLSLSKPFDRLSPNGRDACVMIYEILNSVNRPYIFWRAAGR